jgi:hypothetical protein
MTIDDFWNLIEESRQGTTDCESQADRLASLLAQRAPGEIEAFDRILGERRLEAYRRDLWGVAFLVNGGCSDDGFEYFRCWLVSRGRQFFQACLASPTHVGTGIEPGEEAECEAILYAANHAYRRVTGSELPPTPIQYPPEPAGIRWTEDQLDSLFPEIAQRF